MKVRWLNRITIEVSENETASNLYNTMERVLQYQDNDGQWHDALDESQPFEAFLIERKEKMPMGQQAYLALYIPYFHEDKSVYHWTDSPDHAITFKTKGDADAMMEVYRATAWEEWPESYVAGHLFNCGIANKEKVINQ